MSRAEFMAGVQHAASMIAEAERIQSTAGCTATIEPELRGGATQNNFAKAYLLRLLHRPEMLEGFSAVLSDYLGMDELSAASYRELTEQQIFDASA